MNHFIAGFIISLLLSAGGVLVARSYDEDSSRNMSALGLAGVAISVIFGYGLGLPEWAIAFGFVIASLLFVAGTRFKPDDSRHLVYHWSAYTAGWLGAALFTLVPPVWEWALQVELNLATLLLVGVVIYVVYFGRRMLRPLWRGLKDRYRRWRFANIKWENRAAPDTTSTS